MKTPSVPASYKGLSRIYAYGLFLSLLLTLSACGGSSSDRPELSISLPSVLEGNSGTVELVFTVTLSEDAEETLTADYTTTDGTATVADNDYTAVNGSITIPEGSRTASVSVFANGDDDFELDESFNLVVSNAQGVRLDESSYSGQGLIENDDDAEPRGYFSGSATLNSTDLNDVKGMVYHEDDRLILISPSANVFFDIELTGITLYDFTGNVSVYVNGQLEQAGLVTVSGTTDTLTLEGSFTGGTGLATGTFDLTFDVNNNTGASLARIENFSGNYWDGIFYSVDSVPGDLGFDDLGAYIGTNTSTPACMFDTGVTLIPPEEINIYQLSNDVIEGSGCNYIGTGYTGYGSVINNRGTDDSLVYAVTNGTFAVFSVFTRDP